MRFQAKSTADFEIVPAGNHVAICNAIIDLGIQPGRGMYPDPKHECYLRFELPTERISYQKDGKDIEGPMSVGRTFTASMSEKANLRKFIEGWFGKKFPTDDAASEFDLKQVLGRRCLLNVTHTEKGQKVYANVTSAAPIPRGMPFDHAQHNPSLYYSLVDPDSRTFDKLPKWIQEKIVGRLPESQPTAAQQKVAAMAEEPPPFDDSIPF